MAGLIASKSVAFTTEGTDIAMVRDSLVIDDSAGNGDGRINSGEQFDLYLNLQNIGTAPAEEVRAVLYSNSPYIALQQPSASYGNILPGQEACPQGDYTNFTVTALDTGERENTEPVEAVFVLKIIDKGGNEWEEEFFVKIYPSLFVELDKLSLIHI